MADIRHTLCTYEHPAARHMIDEWREQMGRRILSWSLCDGNELVRLIDEPERGPMAAVVETERVFIVPIEGNSPDGRVGIAIIDAQRMSGKMRRMFEKHLHFGRLPVGGLTHAMSLWVKE